MWETASGVFQTREIRGVKDDPIWLCDEKGSERRACVVEKTSVIVERRGLPEA